MLKKGRLLWLTVVLLLAFAQAALPALTGVGPVLPDTDGNPLTPPWSANYNGFPTWYRDSLGQTVELAAGDPLTIWDPVILGNAFSAQIKFGSEAMYWTGDASMATPIGTADLIMALECAFSSGDANPGDQIVFARIRIRIDTGIAGTPYNVTRSTYNRSAAVVFGDVFVNVPVPVPAGVGFRVRRPDQPVGSGVLMTRSQNLFYGRVNFPLGLPAPNPTVICTGTTPGTTPTVQEKPLVDAITITSAEATLITGRPNRYTLNIEAFSTDVQAALTAQGWSATKVPMTPPVAPGAPWTLRVAGLAIPPATITVQSTTGRGVQSTVMVVLP